MYIKIVGDTTKYQGKLERVGLHLIKVSGLIQHTSGFRLYLDNDVLVGDYSTFVYPYLNPNLGEGVYMYSDNNLSYQTEIEKPSKEEEEQKKIANVVTNLVSADLNSLATQLNNINEMILPMYEVLLDIQDALQSQGNDAPQENDTVENDTVDTNTTDNGAVIVNVDDDVK